MKLLINTATIHKGGSVQVAQSFIDTCRDIPANDYLVILGLSLVGRIRKEDFPANFQFINIDYRPATRVFSLHARTRFFRQIEKSFRPDVVFTTSGPAYWRPHAPHLLGYNLPHYIYPDSPFLQRLPLFQRAKWNLKGRVIRYYCRHDADAYVVQTDDVNRRARIFLGKDRVYTVSNTCASHYFASRDAPNKLPARQPGEFRLLTLSAWYAHKNLAIIPRVVDALPRGVRERVRFVLTLPEEEYQAHFPAPCRGAIVNVGPVPVDQGPSLYRECDAMFLPTLLECFSASYPEAMATRRPILTSDLDFARSICREAALYFDPLDPLDIARTIVALVESEPLRQQLADAGGARLADFGTAQSRACHYLELCAELADGWQR